MNVTCLIPFYNEGMRIAAVLHAVTRIRRITQVLCVDDGSTDGTAVYVRRHWPKVQVVAQTQNKGKAAAINYALQFVKNEVVLLMDADLQGIKQAEVAVAIHAFLAQPAIDMIILRRVNAPWFVRWYRSDVLLSGERILRRSDLEQAMQQRVQRYQLEVGINRYMLRNKKTVRWMPCSARNTYKVGKLGILDGSRKEFQMYVEIVSFVGFSHMLLQLASFTKQYKMQQLKKNSPTGIFRGKRKPTSTGFG